MTGRDLTRLLDDASEHLVERDFAERAWIGAAARRRRRARVLVGAVAAACLGGAVLHGGSGDPGRIASPPGPGPSASSSPAEATRTTKDGTPYSLAPALGTESALAHRVTSLPEQIVIPDSMPTLAERKIPEVAAVLLVQRATLYRPILVGTDGTYVDAGLDLHSVTVNKSAAPPLTTRAIAPDGHRVAFVQPGVVQILDTSTGELTKVPVAEQGLNRGGWSVDGQHVIVGAEGRAWAVDPVAGTARALSQPGYDGYYQIVSVGSRPDLHSWDSTGHATSVTSLTAPISGVWADTVSNVAGWAGTAVFLDQDWTSDSGQAEGYQGLLAVQGDIPSRYRLLVLGETPGRLTGCCSALGWADGTTLLYQSRGGSGVWVLGWDVVSGKVSRVSHIPADPRFGAIFISLGPLT